MKKLVIGLLGPSKSGKDWLGKLLIKTLNKKFIEMDGLIKAADLIKEEAEKRYPASFSIFKWEHSGDAYREEYVEEMGKTRRQLLQDLGDELLEKDPNYVYSYLYTRIKESTSELTLITDLRNENECSAVVDCGGIVIKINRPLGERYTEEWTQYCLSLKRPPNPSTSGFLNYAKSNYTKLYKKLNHKTETSVNKVPRKLIHFEFENSIGKGNSRRISSLLQKLKAI